MFDKTCRIPVASYSVFIEVVISNRSHYGRRVDEGVAGQYLLLLVTRHVSCGGIVKDGGLTRKELTLK
jgi:hypothetical protein